MAKGSATWKRVKFGEVVRQVKAKVQPESSGLTRYVAGEHMDTDDLRIRRWGQIGDGYIGPAFHMRFKPGQVLYGSRRTYLRKVAIADFEGICANTTFVLESADPSKLLPGFLPFVMQTEAFHEHSRRESKGSVNPYVNFSDLAWYEFPLPPPAEQSRMIDELDALETARADAHDAWRAGEQFLEVLTWNLCTGKRVSGARREPNEWEHARLPGVTSIPRDWSIRRLTDVARLESGHTPSRSKPDYWHGGIPWISLADIQRLGKPAITETDEDIAQLGVENSSARLLPAGTVVLSRTAMIGFTSVTTRPMTTSQDFANFVCSDALNPTFLFWLFMGMKEFFDYTAIGSSNVKTIYMPFFQNMQIALPPRAVQDEIVDQLVAVRSKVDALRAREGDHARFTAALRESRIGGAS